MSRKKSIMRSQVVPLLFNECRVVKKRYKYEVPYIKWVRSLTYKLDFRQLYKDLPLSDSEFLIFFPEVAEDLGLLISSYNGDELKKFVM